jgi:tetratricopeptide (TPR) repeat protein
MIRFKLGLGVALLFALSACASSGKDDGGKQDPGTQPKAARAHGASPVVHIKQGDQMLAAGNYDGAIGEYSIALDGNPNSGDALLGRGHAKLNKGDIDGALADFNAPMTGTPVALYLFRGIAKAKKDDREGAIADLSQAIQLEEETISSGRASGRLLDTAKGVASAAYRVRGEQKNLKGDADGAMSDFDAALRVVPANPPARLGRARLRLKKGDEDGASGDFEEAIRSAKEQHDVTVEAAAQKEYAPFAEKRRAAQQKAEANAVADAANWGPVTFDDLNDVFGGAAGNDMDAKAERWKEYKGKRVRWRGEVRSFSDGVLHVRHVGSTVTADVDLTITKEQQEKGGRPEGGRSCDLRGNARQACRQFRCLYPT